MKTDEVINGEWVVPMVFAQNQDIEIKSVSHRWGLGRTPEVVPPLHEGISEDVDENKGKSKLPAGISDDVDENKRKLKLPTGISYDVVENK